MNNQNINSAFIDKIRGRIDGSAIETLTDILSLSKEAISRRLRGQVPFTYSEASTISQKLHISLDELSFGADNHFLFQTLSSDNNDEVQGSLNILKLGINVFKNEKYKKQTHIYIASSDIPLCFIGEHEHLFKFYYYKDLHNRASADAITKKFGDVHVPMHVKEDLKTYLRLFWTMDTTFMLSNSAFEHYMKVLKYFIAVGLIDQSEIELIKKDLHDMIHEMEAITTVGMHKKGSQLTTYICDIDIDASWGYLKSESNEIAFTRILTTDHAISENPSVCKMYRNSINDLKRYATLISQSGSAQRTNYFAKQKLIVEEYLN